MYEDTYHLLQHFNNSYAATMYAAQQARKILTFSHNALTESEAIQWVTSMRPPSELDDYIKKCRPRIRERKYSLINEYASQIDDQKLKTQFQESAIHSNKAEKLIICYGELDSEDCVRLRILLKQYWLEHLQTEVYDIKIV